MKFLIVEPSPLPILIPLGSKYPPQDPVGREKIEVKIEKPCDLHLNVDCELSFDPLRGSRVP